MIRLQIIDTAPEGVYERKNFQQVMERTTQELEKILGYVVLEVKARPPHIKYNFKGPEVKVDYHMFGSHVQIQAIGKDEVKVELVRELIRQAVTGLEAEINAA